MKKITALTLVLLCTVLILSSCAGSRMGKTYDLDWKPENRVLTSAQALDIEINPTWKTKINDARTMLSYVQYAGQSTKTLCVFSAFTDTVIKSVPFTEETAAYVHFPPTPEGGIFSILYVEQSNYAGGTTILDFDVRLKINAKLKLEIYDGHGNLIASLGENELTSHTFEAVYDRYLQTYGDSPIVTVDNVCYLEEDGALKKVADLGLVEIDAPLYRAGDYYYTHTSAELNENSRAIRVYDQNLVSLYYYGYINGGGTAYNGPFFLQNGSFILQKYASVGASATEYDFQNNGTKYKMVTQLHDVESGQVQTLDTDYWISAIDVAGEGDAVMFSSKLENVARVYRINPVNRMLEKIAQYEDLVSLSNDGKFGKSLKLTPYQVGLPTAMGDGLYRVQDAVGVMRVFDSEGEEVFQYSQSLLKGGFGPYLYDDRAIYDLRGNTVFNLAANGMHVKETFDETALLIKYGNSESVQDAIYLFMGEKNAVWIGEAATIQSAEDYYTVTRSVDGEDHIFYYNEYGRELLEINVIPSKEPQILLSGINGIVLRDSVGNLYKLNASAS